MSERKKSYIPSPWEKEKKSGDIINTAKVSTAVIDDMKSVVGSIYRMNAPYAAYYGFNISQDGKSVGVGEFLSRTDKAIERYDYLFDLETKELTRN